MPLSPGEKLGPYEILSQLGKGGMGEVWRARDTRLNRDVAIKTSREEFNERFKIEARTVASLNHPNICHLYDVGPNYLVMELVEGSDLRGPLPVDEGLRIAGQIALALEAAHEKGIVHRDLKPANVKITPDGVVKVLDFGLARLVAAEPEVTSDSPTMMGSPTIVGTILGTAAYMAPEQARGKVVDKRADIWAFGVVLYEITTGKRLFEGETVSDVLAGVLKQEPDLSEVPAKLRRLVAKCLEKDPKKRLRDIGDWVQLLDETAVAAPSRSRFGRGWMAAGVLVAVGLGSAATWFATRPAPPPETRVDIVTPPSAAPQSFALSPDGRQIAYVAANGNASQLWVRSLATGSAQPIAGTEGARFPFWSPDSRSLGFFAGSKLKRVDVGGSAPQILADAPVGNGGTWNAEGTILFIPSADRGVFRVPATGGEPAPVISRSAGQAGLTWPRFLPDGRHFLVFVTGSQAGIYWGELRQQGELSPELKRLTATGSPGEYLSSAEGGDWLAYVQQGTLLARRFDAAQGQLSGDPVTVAQFSGVETGSQAGAFSVSRSGLIAWRAGAGADSRLVWFNRAGERTGTLGVVPHLAYPELSPDGRSVLVTGGPSGRRDVWLIANDRSTRFSFNPTDDVQAVWSPDGQRVAFASNRKGFYDLYVKPADGSGPEQLLRASADGKTPTSWSPDGRFLLYRSDSDLMVLPLSSERDGKPFAFLKTPFIEANGVFSPDGKWVAYQSDESGRYEVYVRPFPGPGGVWQISTGGGSSPRWRADAGELYYVAPGNKLMAAAITPQGGSITPGQPAPLFTASFAPDYFHAQYDVARDGRFLVNVEVEDATLQPPITLLMNWKGPR